METVSVMPLMTQAPS